MKQNNLDGQKLTLNQLQDQLTNQNSFYNKLFLEATQKFDGLSHEFKKLKFQASEDMRITSFSEEL